MGAIAITGSGGVRADLTGDDRSAEVVLVPSGVTLAYQLDGHFAAELFQDVSAHFAEHGAVVRMIRYRGDLAPITVADLATFAVPILPAEG